ncbi:hypothetical protein KGF57_000218 [Candida theae]|uniref:FAD dependent oxidoreductase domain-containing protein n=1 Tax=Candida theae TaxID=1198502 RepID=A0AAD5G114_9ASCO|nr:uncharacterized protein KGF57_000218 [Candida theae]KAI5968359.1 hypothetical protein KGF57_000218 [Candida theae]
MPLQIVIVGAGILGLTTALTLSEKLTDEHEIYVIAEYGPHDPRLNTTMSNFHEYTSPWAGAHFRPFPSANEQDKKEMKMTRDTLRYFTELAASHPESSIKFVDGIEYLQNANDLYKTVSYGYSEGINNFAKTGQEGFVGFKYDTWVLNPILYLQFIYRKLVVSDVMFIHKKLNSLREISTMFKSPVIINCSGMGLQYNGGYDTQCFPIRGQTLLVKPPRSFKLDTTITYQLEDGSWVFIIARPFNGGVILGGTKQLNDTYLGVREEDTRHLLNLGRRYFPDLQKSDVLTGKSYFDIERINVGLRPARVGGLNTSVEFHDGHPVINNYGAGGMGYELSYGASLQVYKNLVSVLNKSKL